MKPENKNMLVRGYVSACTCWEGGPARLDDPDGTKAYTFWYRHDGDLKRLERELDTLVRFYMSYPYCGACQCGYEYKPYRS